MCKASILMIAAGVALLLLSAAARQKPAAPARDYQTAQQATALAASAGAMLLAGADAPRGLLHPDGCVIWSQPGVALTPGTVYVGGAPISETLAYDPARAQGMLYCLPLASWGQPPAPREEDYANGTPAPRAWLLDRTQARERLGRYRKAYDEWRKAAGDPLLPAVPKGSAGVEFAIVYVGGGGPLELYFQREAGGRLRLRHLIYYDYFSA